MNNINLNRNMAQVAPVHVPVMTHTDVDINDNYLIVNITLGEEAQKFQQAIKRLIATEKVPITSGKIFSSFKGRGKHKEILFDYDAETYELAIQISKPYFSNVLRLEEYEILIIGRSLVGLLEEFMVHIRQFVRLMAEPKTREWELEIYSLDVISITICKTFATYDTSERKVYKKIFLRESFFEFKRCLSYRVRESEQLYCYVVLTSPPVNTYEDQPEFKPVITDKQFYFAPRVNYVDDLHTNESLLKRFSFRFLCYYQAFSLSYGLVPLDNHYIREFYRKCFCSSTFYAIRLKKLGFTFNIRRLLGSKDPQKQRLLKASIYFYYDDQYTNFSQEQPSADGIIKNFFRVDIQIPGVSQKFLLESFMKRIKRSLEYEKQESSNILIRHPNNNRYVVKPRNENSYCIFLNEFSFFLDYLFFKLIEVRDRDRKRKEHSRGDTVEIPFPLEEDVQVLKFPPSPEFNLKKSKYSHFYQVGIRSKYSPKHHTNYNQFVKYKRDLYSYENEISEIKMTRRKKTDADNYEAPHDFLEKGSENLKGLKIYINSVLHCWNARDCFEEVTEFVRSYMDIISDKMKEQIRFKTNGKWPKVLPNLSYLLHTLTQSFNTPLNTFYLKILEGYEDNKDGSQPGFNADLADDDCIMVMTFSLYQLTQAGWTQTLPGCVYFFDVFKSEVRMRMYCDKRVLTIPDGKDRRTIERLCKQYMRDTFKQHKIKAKIPPLNTQA